MSDQEESKFDQWLMSFTPLQFGILVIGILLATLIIIAFSIESAVNH